MSLLEPHTQEAHIVVPLLISQIPIINMRIKVILGFFVLGALLMVGIIFINKELMIYRSNFL